MCLLSGQVAEMAAFYRWLLGVAGESDDPVHQTVLGEEPMLTVYRGEGERPQGQTVSLAFTVADVDAEYRRLLAAGVPVVQPPATQPWGARNLCLLDPDGNRVYLRTLPITTKR
ncbi:MAG: VOC family protein [Eubacteriales bacterium]|nr:VOC family protein [Eubacteriales bacterium]